MPLRCDIKSAYIQPPEVGLTFQESLAISSSPFTLHGAPMQTPPQSLTGLSEFRRKPNAYSNFAMKDLYFDKRNYYEVFLDSENILEGNSATTLRYEGTSFTLSFGAVHRGIWDSKQAQLSFLFSNNGKHYFHICLPIQYTEQKEKVNPFMKAWFTSSIPSGFTMNDVFSFSSDSSKFTMYAYCLDLNKGRSTSTYTVCYFDTPVFITKQMLPKWFADDPLLQKDTPIPDEMNAGVQRIRRNTFDQIFNFMLRGTVQKWVADTADPYLVSDEIYFKANPVQRDVKPLYVQVPTKELSGRTKAMEGFTGNISTRPIKCYPINLQTQVAADGTIQVDSNGKLVPLEEAQQSSLIKNIENVSADTFVNSLRYWLLFIILFIVAAILLVGIVFFIFRSSSTIKSVIVDATTVGSTAAGASLIIPTIQTILQSSKTADEKIQDIQLMLAENKTMP